MAITELDAIKRFLESKNATDFKYETIKISTINSFKGWESEVVFLIFLSINRDITLVTVMCLNCLFTHCLRKIVGKKCIRQFVCQVIIRDFYHIVFFGSIAKRIDCSIPYYSLVYNSCA